MKKKIKRLAIITILLASSVVMSKAEGLSLPYTISTDSLETDLATTGTYYKNYMYYLWWDAAKRLSAWVYTPYSGKEAYLYTTKTFALKKGKAAVEVYCTSTAPEKTTMQVFLTKDVTSYGDAAGGVVLKQTLIARWQKAVFDVPEDGDYHIALKPISESSSVWQTALGGLTITDDTTIVVKPKEPEIVDTNPPYALPYQTSFETSEDECRWYSVNPDDDDEFWGIASSYKAMEGKQVMFINNNLAQTHNDYALSPKFTLPANTELKTGFYYCANTPTKGGTIDVILTQETFSDSIQAKGTVLKTFDVNSSAWQEIAIPFSVDKAGDYRIAIYHHGNVSPISVDYFYISEKPEPQKVGESEILCGYYNDSVPAQGLRINNLTTGKLYGFTPIPEGNAGKVIDAINVGLKVINDTAIAQIIITDSIGGSPLYKQEFTPKPMEWNHVSLNEPYIISASKTIYVGYSIDSNSKDYPAGYNFVNEQDVYQSYVCYQSSTSDFIKLDFDSLVVASAQVHANLCLNAVLQESTSVTDVQSPVVNCEYYNIKGIKVDAKCEGILIRKETHQNGTTTFTKILNK